MENVLDIINNIGSFVQYFASGFLFLSAYDFAGSLPREKEKEYFFVKSITVSFVINAIISFIFNKAKVDMQYYFLALILSAVVLGLLLGRARSFGWINTICIKVFRHNIADNIFLTIWSSVSNGKCLYIRFKKKDCSNSYEGQVYDISSLYQDPIFRLKYYVVKDKKGKIREDFSYCDCAQMIVSWSQMDDIEIASEDWGKDDE
ncbi:hypothetical protein [Mediterraneibacter gnavus]|uniref:hypothetical protein n=1 Tax=Mediterraneibacter gnavus TaxID=33038 RepID=UPI0032B7E77B